MKIAPSWIALPSQENMTPWIKGGTNINLSYLDDIAAEITRNWWHEEESYQRPMKPVQNLNTTTGCFSFKLVRLEYMHSLGHFASNSQLDVDFVFQILHVCKSHLSKWPKHCFLLAAPCTLVRCHFMNWTCPKCLVLLKHTSMTLNTFFFLALKDTTGSKRNYGRELPDKALFEMSKLSHIHKLTTGNKKESSLTSQPHPEEHSHKAWRRNLFNKLNARLWKGTPHIQHLPL